MQPLYAHPPAALSSMFCLACACIRSLDCARGAGAAGVCAGAGRARSHCPHGPCGGVVHLQRPAVLLRLCEEPGTYAFLACACMHKARTLASHASWVFFVAYSHLHVNSMYA